MFKRWRYIRKYFSLSLNYEQNIEKKKPELLERKIGGNIACKRRA